MVARPYVSDCSACSFEAEFGSEECPHPVDARAHSCPSGQVQAEEERALRQQTRGRAKMMSFTDPTEGRGMSPESYRLSALNGIANNLKVPHEEFHKELNKFIEGFPFTKVDVWLLSMELEDLRLFRELLKKMVHERDTLGGVHDLRRFTGLSMERFAEVTGTTLEDAKRLRDRMLDNWPALRDHIHLLKGPAADTTALRPLIDSTKRFLQLTDAAHIVRDVLGEHGMVIFNKRVGIVHVANLDGDPLDGAAQAVTAKTLAEAIESFEQKYPREKKDG